MRLGSAWKRNSGEYRQSSVQQRYALLQDTFLGGLTRVILDEYIRYHHTREYPLKEMHVPRNV
jgi:hypothetical protein